MAEDPNPAAKLADGEGDASRAALAAKTGEGAPDAPKKIKTPDEIIAEQAAELQRKDGEIALERSGRQRAESLAATRTGEAFASAEGQVKTGLTAAQEKRKSLQKEYQAAFEAGDAAKLADIQIQMSDNAVDLRGWENAGRTLEQRKKAATDAVVDVNEQVISQLSAPAQRWMRAHPEYIKNGVLDFRMQSVHYQALADGIEADSPKYFAFIEKGLGLVNGTRREDPPEPRPGEGEEPRTSHRMSSAAPPSREAGGSSRRVPTSVSEVTLTDAERDQALAEHPELEPTKAIARYASNKLVLMQEGAYDRR